LWSPHELTKSQNTTRDVQLIEYLREDLRSNTDMGLNGEYRSSNFKLRNGSTKATIGFAELIANGKYKLYKAFSGNKPATRGGYENYLDSKHLPSENLNQSNRSTDVEPKILESILLETTPATEGTLVLSVNRETCTSCSFYGIPRFQRLRPGIKVEIKKT
jgi:hypothetical protein